MDSCYVLTNNSIEKGREAKHNWKNAMEDIWFAVKNPNYYFSVDDKEH